MDHRFGIDSRKRAIVSFRRFIWVDRTNRFYLFAAVATIGILWTVFKILYPYPNIIFDSYNYMKAAALNWNFNAWPIGYSKILQVFTLFSHSANLLVSLQYFFLELSCLYFFFTWLFLFRPGRFVSHALFISLFLNPIFPYCSNYILSDPIFIGLSVLWISQLLWLIYRPKSYMIIVNAVLIVMAFAIRYSALYYPIVAALAFMLSRQGVKQKIVGIGLPLILLGSFILYTSYLTVPITGQKQFSAFGSWKLANDALIAYKYVLPGNIDSAPEKFRLLDNRVRQYFRVTKDTNDLLHSDYTLGSYYMFDPKSPLVEYMNSLYGPDQRFLNTKKWLIVAPLYQSYGIYIIRKYPAAFTRYFLFPNLFRYMAPPGEIFGSPWAFEWREVYGGEYVRKLFKLNTITTPSSSIKLSLDILNLYPSIMAIVHGAFILGLLGFTIFGGFTRIDKLNTYYVLFIVGLWVCDFVFSIFSAGIVLRYQLSVMIPEMAAGLYFFDYVSRNLDRKESFSQP
jgi:hypothetical protein